LERERGFSGAGNAIDKLKLLRHQSAVQDFVQSRDAGF
jgi:hypothetical protein